MKRVILFILLGLLTFPTLAHRVNLFCYIEGNILYGEGYFSGGSPAKNSKIEVYDIEGQRLLASTITDDQGRFSLPLKKRGKLKVILVAHPGHKAEYVLENTEEEDTEDQDTVYEKLDYKKIEEIVEEKTRPIYQQLAELEKRSHHPNWSAIIGGIGWIVGIFSLLYLLRKKDAS
jgi:nickel transport protein